MPVRPQEVLPFQGEWFIPAKKFEQPDKGFLFKTIPIVVEYWVSEALEHWGF